MPSIDVASFQALEKAFDAENFRNLGHTLIDQLSDYLASVTTEPERSGFPVLPAISPNEMLKQWGGEFSQSGGSDFNTLIEHVIAQSNHLHHPHYIGHQVSAPLPLAALCDLVASFLNNGTAVYEMGPVSTIMEKRIIQWMAMLIGYDVDQADGVLTSGGSMGNLTALLAARQVKAGYDIWNEGTQHHKPLGILVSEQNHYSIKRAAQIMGLGEQGVISVPVDANFKLRGDALETTYHQACQDGYRIIAVVANACSTATGTYDPLDEIADFCEKHHLWLHVDGAHGASALVSEKYKHLLSGIERADSVVWDAHKMLLMPGLITGVIFRNGQHSYETFSQQAAYLFECRSEEEWFNLAHRTLECTKRMMSLKLYMALHVYGTQIFDTYVARCYDKTKWFAEHIQKSPDFEIALAPESNIICFRYIPPGVDNLDVLQAKIRKHLLAEASFYIVQTQLPQGTFLRCTIITPGTTENDLSALLDQIRKVGHSILVNVSAN